MSTPVAVSIVLALGTPLCTFEKESGLVQQKQLRLQQQEQLEQLATCQKHGGEAGRPYDQAVCEACVAEGEDEEPSSVLSTLSSWLAPAITCVYHEVTGTCVPPDLVRGAGHTSKKSGCSGMQARKEARDAAIAEAQRRREEVRRAAPRRDSLQDMLTILEALDKPEFTHTLIAKAVQVGDAQDTLHVLHGAQALPRPPLLVLADLPHGPRHHGQRLTMDNVDELLHVLADGPPLPLQVERGRAATRQEMYAELQRAGQQYQASSRQLFYSWVIMRRFHEASEEQRAYYLRSLMECKDVPTLMNVIKALDERSLTPITFAGRGGTRALKGQKLKSLADVGKELADRLDDIVADVVGKTIRGEVLEQMEDGGRVRRGLGTSSLGAPPSFSEPVAAGYFVYRNAHMAEAIRRGAEAVLKVHNEARVQVDGTASGRRAKPLPPCQHAIAGMGSYGAAHLYYSDLSVPQLLVGMRDFELIVGPTTGPLGADLSLPAEVEAARLGLSATYVLSHKASAAAGAPHLYVLFGIAHMTRVGPNLIAKALVAVGPALFFFELDDGRWTKHSFFSERDLLDPQRPSTSEPPAFKPPVDGRSRSHALVATLRGQPGLDWHAFRRDHGSDELAALLATPDMLAHQTYASSFASK